MKQILLISRPRLWIYTLGSFLMGISLSNIPFDTLFSKLNLWEFIYLTFWLTVPANLFLYALNDAYDVETDANNPKKGGFELKSNSGDKKKLIIVSIVSLLLYIPLLKSFDATTLTLFLVWIIIILTYNIPPLRLKGRPFLDNIFALNFPLWGVYSYYLINSELPSLSNMLILAIFACIMHIYTATGDIEYDRQANIYTTAVFFKTVKTNLWICLLLSYGLVFYFFLIPNILLIPIALMYIIFFSYCYIHHDSMGLISYRYFLYLHYTAGFILANTSVIQYLV